MKHKNQIIYKRRPFYSNDFRTTSKIKRSRKARKIQPIQPGHLLFPSSLPNENDSNELKEFKKFRMKFDLIIRSIEGYINEKQKTNGTNLFHVGSASSRESLRGLFTNNDNHHHQQVEEWFETLKKLRVFALKEIPAFTDSQTDYYQKMLEAVKMLDLFHQQIKRWWFEYGETLERQNIAILAEDNLVLDFLPVDHAINAGSFISDLEKACKMVCKAECDELGTQDRVEAEMKKVLKKMGRKQRLADEQEAIGKQRGNLKGALLGQYEDLKNSRTCCNSRRSSRIMSNTEDGVFGSPDFQSPSNRFNLGNNRRNRGIPLDITSPDGPETPRNRLNHENNGQNRRAPLDILSPDGPESPRNRLNRENNGRKRPFFDSWRRLTSYLSSNNNTQAGNDGEFFSNLNAEEILPPIPPSSQGLNTLEGRKRKYSVSEHNDKKRRMELIVSKIAKYEKKINLIQSKIEKLM